MNMGIVLESLGVGVIAMYLFSNISPTLEAKKLEECEGHTGTIAVHRRSKKDKFLVFNLNTALLLIILFLLVHLVDCICQKENTQ